MITDEKASIRVMVRQRRRMLSPDAALAAQTLAAVHLEEAIESGALPLAPGAVISGYYSRGPEFDVSPMMTVLFLRGYRLTLPVVVARGAPLVFRAWRPGDAVVPGNGADVPPPDAAELTPDLLIVPLVAFDRAGGRLGQGGGYYDRTLAARRARGPIRAIGVGYACQEVDRLPLGPYDQRLDGILTENGLLTFDGRP